MSQRRAEDTTDEAAIADMREHWRQFAREDAMFYIAADRRDWDEGAFYESGSDLVADVLDWAGDALKRGRMLEIGCGMGRLLVHFAGEFEQVDGIDIAPEMIERARPKMPANVSVQVGSGWDLSSFGDDELDFVFSFIVFQHIPDAMVIGSYLREAKRTLKAGGTAIFQYDTRPKTLASRAAFRLPDLVLPTTRRRFIRRYRLEPGQVRGLASEAGLELLAERDPGTELHFLMLRA